tara:strand:- start:151 stop:618 length:468 start_codon:yes stop_codon:yes gene_type:complete
MAGVQLKDLDEALSSGDDDLLHIQTEGSFVDQSIKKSVFLASFLAEFEQLKQDIADSLNAIAIPQTGGGTLTEGRINEIQDSLGYFLPKADSVPANTTITILITDKFAAEAPTIFANTVIPDTIKDELNTYSGILFDAGAVSITLISDGVSEWRF